MGSGGTSKRGTTARCRTILIVEDDPDIRDAIRSILEDEGYEVEEATNGREGLERLRTIERPCLVLLDLMMPVMSGPEFLAALQNEDAIATIPVVVVSAWTHMAAVVEGSVGFIKKPVNLDQLLDSVRQYCHP